MPTVFEKLLSGELPCAKVCEDDLVFAFMDAGQVNDGHVIVATKAPRETLLDCSDDEAAAAGLLKGENQHCRYGYCQKCQMPPLPLAMQRGRATRTAATLDRPVAYFAEGRVPEGASSAD
jgi:hypothetical protein